MTPQLDTPVALIIFNRPDTTRRVFAAIRGARPRRLLVVADGPRPGRPGEAEACAEARSIIDAVDWPCDVQTNYAEANLGCKRRVSSGLDWVFQTVEEAIILEDDCVPHPSFFTYCTELLGRYRDDERVMHIGGANFQLGRRYGDAAYYFSRYAHVWGWASWRRAWTHYNVELRRWPIERETILNQFETSWEADFWRFVGEATSAGKIDTWDYQWALACLERRGLAIVPNGNLVANIGFGPNATHTSQASRLANLPLEPLALPLAHPQSVEREAEADARVRKIFFDRRGPVRRFAGRLGDLSSQVYQRYMRGAR